jgi:ribosome modulation factor
MKSQPDSSLLIRMAIRAGATVGRWQRRLAARRDDAVVEKWKAAWAEGSDAHRAGTPQERVPYRRSARRAAWLAGWQWAEQQAGRPPHSLSPVDSTGAARQVSARPLQEGAAATPQEAAATTPVEPDSPQKGDIRFQSRG